MANKRPRKKPVARKASPTPAEVLPMIPPPPTENIAAPTDAGKAAAAQPETVTVFVCSLELKAALLDFLENEPLPMKKTGPLVAGLAQMPTAQGRRQ